jgi:hypothetical protein
LAWFRFNSGGCARLISWHLAFSNLVYGDLGDGRREDGGLGDGGWVNEGGSNGIHGEVEDYKWG